MQREGKLYPYQEIGEIFIDNPHMKGQTFASGGIVPGFVVAGSGEALSPSLPGRDSVAVVVCGEGALALLSVQRPGKRATPIEQYLNGDRQLIGARLG